jgi:phenylacetate-CoA ligase
VTNSPDNRDLLGRDARRDPVLLEELPKLPKATLMEHFDELVTDQRVTLAGIQAHLEGADPDALFLGRYRVLSTSGTTGLRGVVVMGGEEFETWIALTMRVLAKIGLLPETRLAALGAPSPLPWTNQLFSALRAGRKGAPRLSVLSPIEETTDALDAYQPEALLGYPSFHGVLAQEQLEGRLSIRPSVVGCGGEAVTGDVARRIDAAWGIRPTVIYAATEAPILAAGSKEHDLLEIPEDVVIVEVVDERDGPVPPGTAGAKVLVTNLVNRVQPLIRYELSDAVTPAGGANPTGRPYACIAGVEGRAADTLELPSRNGGVVAVHPVRLGAPFAGLLAVRQFQILHDESGITVHAVLRDPAAVDVLQHVRAALVEALEEAGAVPPRVRVEAVTEIEREPGPAAKFRIVKSSVAGKRPG